ncbi:hypothetical protein EYF80_040514 [Liparis tanakae]|uniref:Uncharacterized protein n=1 Tax=Liparis tanakae TaxID=230148 RepID=A0A4Z2G6U1_9TELE|nr:hypothetical protein EYF80_040514 [Liparis tanakae]
MEWSFSCCSSFPSICSFMLRSSCRLLSMSGPHKTTRETLRRMTYPALNLGLQPHQLLLQLHLAVFKLAALLLRLPEADLQALSLLLGLRLTLLQPRRRLLLGLQRGAALSVGFNLHLAQVLGALVLQESSLPLQLPQGGLHFLPAAHLSQKGKHREDEWRDHRLHRMRAGVGEGPYLLVQFFDQLV